MWNPLRASPVPRVTDAILPLSLGSDSSGSEVVVDLHTLPHMLIGGMVGSGKSVLLHNIPNSLISEVGPGRLRLILCDFKYVEFDAYNASRTSLRQ
jgi:DNA segregation ATPase FtsK/SpoIIIE, S-DNA-T family